MTEQTSTATCKYPGCENPPGPASAEPGRPPQYCTDPAHNAVIRVAGAQARWPTPSAA